jgi:flagellar basal-body rod modification protein FlgD
VIRLNLSKVNDLGGVNMASSVGGTNNVWPNYGKANMNTQNVTEQNKTLDQNSFLKILITQLQNQDPSQPLQDREFIAQMAQFTSVEQLGKMASEMKLLRHSLGFSSSLIGKNVSWEMFQGDQAVLQSGTVEAVTNKNGEQFVKVGNQEVPLDSVLKVWIEGE